MVSTPNSYTNQTLAAKMSQISSVKGLEMGEDPSPRRCFLVALRGAYLAFYCPELETQYVATNQIASLLSPNGMHLCLYIVHELGWGLGDLFENDIDTRDFNRILVILDEYMV